jgi:hypothetical protein
VAKRKSATPISVAAEIARSSGVTADGLRAQLEADLSKPVRPANPGQDIEAYIGEMAREHGLQPLLAATLGARDKVIATTANTARPPAERL